MNRGRKGAGTERRMNMDKAPSLRERFQGCLLGLAIGDGLGARFEGQAAENIRGRYPSADTLIRNPPNKELWYTDDTQMMIGVAETLVENREINEERLCAAFVLNYVPSRGYGRGTRKVLEAMEDGKDYRLVAAANFPGGSLGNGAAMRVAPIGLFLRYDAARVTEQARASAIPTHQHPLGIKGAQVLAHAIALASRDETFDRAAFFAELIARCATEQFREKLAAAARMTSFDEVATLGNGIEALGSVPTAIACFSLAPQSFTTAVGSAILLGGDADTIGAMTGAIAGAFLGVAAIPSHLLNMLEDQVKGRTYIAGLADKLHERYEGDHATRDS
jgi:poly(ADP-ribose) glycohydrolase ARH3